MSVTVTLQAMEAGSLKFTSEQVIEITGCSPNVLKEITRNRSGKPPFLKPDWEAEGRGYIDYYSWNNLMCVALFLELRKTGIERKLIIPILWAAKNIDYGDKYLSAELRQVTGGRFVGTNPFKEVVLKSYPINVHPSNFKNKPIPEREPDMFLSVTSHINNIYKCNLGCENLHHFFEGAYESSTPATIRVIDDKVSETIPKTEIEKIDMVWGGIVSIRFALNKLHFNVVTRAKKLGYI